MKKKLLIATLALFGFGGGLAIGTQPSRAQSVPACATDGDKDWDGVLDADDSDEQDSCSATSTGTEDCETGAGDGLADCS